MSSRQVEVMNASNIFSCHVNYCRRLPEIYPNRRENEGVPLDTDSKEQLTNIGMKKLMRSRRIPNAVSSPILPTQSTTPFLFPETTLPAPLQISMFNCTRGGEEIYSGRSPLTSASNLCRVLVALRSAKSTAVAYTRITMESGSAVA